MRSQPIQPTRSSVIRRAWNVFAASGSTAFALVGGAAQAGHGFNAIGFGAESVGLASADVALARDSVAINTNPAGLTQVSQGAWDAFINPFDIGGMTHSDVFGNDEYGVDNPYGAIAAGSYARRLKRRPDWVLAGGLFVQGGTGFIYEDLATAFGTRDELGLEFGVFKLVGGFGWSPTPRLSLGANVGLSYAQGKQKFFPETSEADAGFFGQRFDGGEAWAPNLQLGLLYRLTPQLTLGAAYASEIAIDLKNATLTVNYDALGLGRVTYRDAELTGFALPAELSLGFAWQFHSDWLLATEVKWPNWASSIKSSTVRASNPDREGLDASLRNVEVSSRLEWDDQYVVALGLEWRYSERTRLRVGLDLPSDPVPHENLSPLLNVVQKEQITAGFSRDFSEGWRFEYAIQYQLPHEIEYTNEALPFGPDARLEYSVLAMVFSVGRRW